MGCSSRTQKKLETPMISPQTLSLALAVLVLPLTWVYFQRRGSGSNQLPGPPSDSWVFGHYPQLQSESAGALDFKWQAQYGGILRFKGAFGEDHIMVSDPLAVQYVYHQAGYTLAKPRGHAELIRLITGRGLIWADGDVHKRQKKVMTPAFSTLDVRAMEVTFLRCARRLVDLWVKTVDNSPGSIEMDVTNPIARATLDAVGIAGFDHDFNTIENEEDPLATIYNNLLKDTHGAPSKAQVFFQSISHHVPARLVEFISDHGKTAALERAREMTRESDRVAKQLIDKGGDSNRNDLLSSLVRENYGKGAPPLSEEEVYAQIRTALLAGHETSSNTLSWALLELARNQHVQERLRDEIRVARQDVGDFAPLNVETMPYLVAFVKEVLRFHPVGHHTVREAREDVNMPLSRPVTLMDGTTVSQWPVRKGQQLVVSVAAYNRHKDVWGEDSHVFDPSRWIEPGRIADSPHVGIYGNMLTFSGGVRSCVGMKFALAEMHAFVIQLVDHFQFDMTKDAGRVRREICLIMVPTVEGKEGVQLPLRISLSPK